MNNPYQLQGLIDRKEQEIAQRVEGNDAALVMQVWPGGPYYEMARLNMDRNAKSCADHGFDWELIVGTMDPKYADYTVGSWVKVEQMIRACEKGYKYVVALEPDTLIKDMEADLRDGCPKGIGACYHRHPIAHQWNVGAIYMTNTPEVQAFLHKWIGEFPAEPVWRDNGAYNVVAMKDKTATTISDRWNATLDVNMVPDAAVIGFHGVGQSGAHRLEIMRKMLERF